MLNIPLYLNRNWIETQATKEFLILTQMMSLRLFLKLRNIMTMKLWMSLKQPSNRGEKYLFMSVQES